MGSFVGQGVHVFGAIHAIAGNGAISDVRGFVAQNNIILGDVSLAENTLDTGVSSNVENRNGSWNYFGVKADGSWHKGQEANPAYHATNNPNVPQYVPLQFDDVAAAKVAYDALT